MEQKNGQTRLIEGDYGTLVMTPTWFSEIVEYEIRNYLHVKALTEIDDSTKKTILDAIMSNEDLLTLWGMSTGHYGEEVSQEVLRRLSEMYLTVCGFSFASSCLELYKQQNRTQLQKSK